MLLNLRPLWACALEAAPVNVRPKAPRAASASRRVMALATIFSSPSRPTQTTRERPWRRSTARRIDRRSTERPLEPSAALIDAVHSPSADGRPSGRPLDRVRRDQRSRLQSAPTQKQSVLEAQLPWRPSRKRLGKGRHAALQGPLDQRLIDRHGEIARDRPQRHVGDNAARAFKQQRSVDRVLRSPKAAEAAAPAAWPEIEIVDSRHQRGPVPVAGRHIGRERLGERAGKRLLHPGRGRIAHAGPDRRDIDLDGADTETGLSQRGPYLSHGWKTKRSEGGKRGAAGQGERGHDANFSSGRRLPGRSDRAAIYRPP